MGRIFRAAVEDQRENAKRAPDWLREQRRYEIARDVFAQMAGSESWDMTWDQSAEVAVRAADALLNALEESSDGE